MTPKVLKQFLAVCRHGSVSSAAREVGIAQPALSKQMAQLEHELGSPLFMRHSRGVALTPQGERLQREASDLVRRMESIRHAIQTEGTLVTGNVVLAVISSLAPVVATSLYPRLERDYPGITLQIIDFPSEQVGQALLMRQADIAVLPSAAIDLPGVKSWPLFEESFHLLTKAGPDAPRTAISLAEAARYPLVMTFLSHDLRRRLEDAARGAGVTLNVKYETGSINVITAMVEQGLASAIVPMTFFLDRLSTGRVVAPLITNPCVTRIHSICILPERPLPPATAAVRALLQAEVQSLLATGRMSGTLVERSAYAPAGLGV